MKRISRLAICSILIFCLIQKIAISGFATDAAQAYLDTAPFGIAEFASDPLGSIQLLLLGDFYDNVKLVVTGYLQLLSFLLLGAMVGVLIVKTVWISLLELLIAGGSFLLISQNLLWLAASLADSAVQWKTFLLGFVPVFATVVASSGETVAASLYSGFFLSAISIFSHVLVSFLVPVIECYLAISITSAFWIGDELPEACETVGKLLKKLVMIAGTSFSFIFGIQRVFSAAADGVVVQASKTIGGTVPIIGQMVSSTASTFFAGLKVLKTGLGFSAIAVISSSFLPLYLLAVMHLCLLLFCGFLCKLFSLPRCGKLFDCLAIGVEAMMAIIALFFFMVSVGTALMLIVGTGG